MKILKFVFVTLVLFIGAISSAQNALFEDSNGYLLSKEGQKKVDLFKSKPGVSKVTLIKVNTKALQSSSIEISIEGKSMVATEIKRNNREDKDFSWFGRLEDGHGIVFTVQGNEIMSKFPFNDLPYAVYPLENGIHMLLTCQENYSPDAHECGNMDVPGIENYDKPQGNENAEKVHPDDNPCNYRLLLVYTQAAETNINLDLRQFSQNLADEANLAYLLSGILLEAEVAKTMIVNHVESNVLVDWPNFDSNVTEDLVNLRNTGDGILDQVHTFRDSYNADVVVMIRELWCETSDGNNHGIAWDFDVPAADAFVVCRAASLTISRFTFTHEIGHLQGGFHDNQSADPVYAKGFIFSSDTTANRTLMSSGCVGANDGCRIQQFSNPIVNFPPGTGGVPTGQADQRDNARRLTETANRTKNYRVTTENLVLQAETIAAQTRSNHLANHTITSNNASIVYSSGSSGTMRAGESILWLPGVHCTSGSTVRAYIVTNPCESLPVQAQGENLSDRNSATQNSGLGIISEESSSSLKLYPNPAFEIINVEFLLENDDADYPVYVDIFDSFGHLITHRQEDYLSSGSNMVTLDIASLPPGVYACQVHTNESKQTKSFIVK